MAVTANNGKITSEVKEKEDIFVLIEASKLSLDDEFMKHKPNTFREETLKEAIIEVILDGISDFYRPRLDPSFDENGRICFEAGREPATDMSYKWWKKAAKAYNPERRSRLGTKQEYIAFLGVLIKTLVANGWVVENAWYAVCNNSKMLGHYFDSTDSTLSHEPTGSREVYGFYDLSNTHKLVTEGNGFFSFWKVGGCWVRSGLDYPISAAFIHKNFNIIQVATVGWIVLEK